VPSVYGREDVVFLGVFDGTVGDHAADYVHATIAEHVCGSKVGVVWARWYNSKGEPTQSPSRVCAPAARR